MKKIEYNILTFIIIEAIFTIFFFKMSFIELLLGLIIGILLIIINKKIKKNKILNSIMFLGSITLSYFLLIRIVNFINYNLLSSYSKLIILISFIIISYYLVKNDYHTFIKTCEILSYLFIFFKVVSFILIIPKINIVNLKSIEINTNISYNLIFLSLIIFFIYNYFHYITNKYMSNKTIIFSFINAILIKLISILVIGYSVFNKMQYPFVNYLKSIKYFDFIERCDGILIFKYLISYYILFTFLLLNFKLLKKANYKLTYSSFDDVHEKPCKP